MSTSPHGSGFDGVVDGAPADACKGVRGLLHCGVPE
jgi:hypothetical protein